MTSPSVAESLLAHASFVQRLARGLAGQDADDLAQEAWVRALAADPTDLRAERSWLAAVLGNLWRNRARAAMRRLRRDAEATSEREEPSVPEILAREEVRRQVVAAVVELEEPLRRVVLLRFYEGLDSQTIARRLGMPASTVRSQLQRALGELRRRLDADHGERRAAWSVPFARWLVPTRTPGLTALLRVLWPLRAFVGALAALLLVWLSAPLWSPSSSPPAPAAPGDVATTTSRENERPQNAAPRESSVVAVSIEPTRGPEDFWGRVIVAADDTPIAGAEVVLEHRDADEMRSLDLDYNQRTERIGSARTDAAGRFAFRVQRALQHRLVVRANGFAPMTVWYGTGGSEFVVRMEQPGFAEGVVRLPDGAPLADAVVEGLEYGVPGGDVVTTRTAVDGSFFLGDLPPRRCLVRVTPNGRKPPDSQRIDVVPGCGSRIEFVVEPGRRAHGVVREAESGEPIAGARIATAWTMQNCARSNADGSYACAGLGDRETLHVRAEGHADLAVFVAGTGADVALDITMTRGASVVGRLVDTGHRPPANAYVAAVSQQQVGNSLHTTWRTGTVASDGSFRVDGLATGLAPRNEPRNPAIPAGYGQWHLLVRAPGLGTRMLALPQRTPPEGMLDVGDIVLVPQALLEGRFVTDDGQPIVRAEVRLEGVDDGFVKLLPAGSERPTPVQHFWQPTTRTGSDGTFRFAGLAPGAYGLAARAAGKDWDVRSGPFAVSEGAIFLAPDLVALPGLTIEGRVHIADRQQPPSKRELSLSARAEGTGMCQAEILPDGTFRFERLQAKAYDLFAIDVPPGYAMAPLRGVAAGTKGVDLRLVVADTVEGRVVDRDDKPLRGFDVMFVPYGGMGSHTHPSDANGRFRIDAAPGVVGVVLAQDPNNMFRQVMQQPVAAGTKDLVLRITN